MGKILVVTPVLVNRSDVFKPFLNNHLWLVLEELTCSAYLLHYMIVIWFFASRESNIILSMSFVLQTTISSCIISYLCAIPFYLSVERPFRNFLDLILFPRAAIFKKSKDVEDEDTTEDEAEED